MASSGNLSNIISLSSDDAVDRWKLGITFQTAVQSLDVFLFLFCFFLFCFEMSVTELPRIKLKMVSPLLKKSTLQNDQRKCPVDNVRPKHNTSSLICIIFTFLVFVHSKREKQKKRLKEMTKQLLNEWTKLEKHRILQFLAEYYSSCFEQVSSFFKTFHNFKAPIKVLILDIGCFHHDIPFANNIFTLSNTIPALENTASGGLPVAVLQGSSDTVKNSKWRSWTIVHAQVTM